MNTLNETRRRVLDLVFKKDSEDKISWTFKEDEKSAQGKFDKFEVHFDRKSSTSGDAFRVFVIGQGEEVLDDFLVRSSTFNKPTELADYLEKIAKLYSRELEKIKIDTLAPFLKRLNEL
ncbi:hypothetical protein CD351_11770 [Erythrobacter sp. KY5]|uniref:hypothetical protein n=1 Tax=Erythrobacter sp. KY5 TaxID=2011159 RepID=UPI000DBF3508|nr:hypothetical protein [Erythrobacter sp. KY5]AWW75105.1 hypothetical protein CD351_11770 [Erythrobacter sp. KY5]